jgi:hypothetical protein
MQYRREFLNADRGTAFIEAEARVSIKKDGKRDLDATMTIADCNRKVTLDFSMYLNTPEERSLLIQKALLFKKLVEEFTASVLKECRRRP